MNAQTMRFLGWVLPIVCMAGGVYATYSQYQRLGEARAAQAAAELDLKNAQAKLDLARKQVEAEGHFAAVPSTDFESTLFLSDLRIRAKSAGTTIQSWKTSTGPAATTGGDKPEDQKRAEVLQGVSRVSSDLVLVGSYQAGRAFIEDLTRTSRLYTINNVRWGRNDDGGTQMTVTVSRYVLQPTGATTPEQG